MTKRDYIIVFLIGSLVAAFAVVAYLPVAVLDEEREQLIQAEGGK